jgi:surface antigen
MRYILALIAVAMVLAGAAPAYAVGSCGGVSDSCQCGANNPYPCCNNGNGKSSNCTWGAWHMACCGFAKGLPGWSHAKYWAGNAKSHPDYEVHGSAKVNSIACRDQGTWGHVAWVTKVNGGSITVHEQSCCEGTSCWPNCSYCLNGFKDSGYQASYYTGGYITKKGGAGPY